MKGTIIGGDQCDCSQTTFLNEDCILKYGVLLAFFQIGPHVRCILAGIIGASRPYSDDNVAQYNRVAERELYKIQEPNTKVIVRYKKRSKVEALKKLKREEQALLERIKDGETSLKADLAVLRLNIGHQSKSANDSYAVTWTWGDKDHPVFKTVVLDLGIIDD